MLALFVTACLASDPANCKDYKVPLDASLEPSQCMIHAAPQVARWGSEHPDLQITKYRCRPTDESGN